MVGLRAGGLQLVNEVVHENIVADDIFLAVMLMETGTLATIDQVILHTDAGRTFVGIESPTTVTERVDVVDMVVADLCTVRIAQGIDTAHIAEYAPPDMVDVVIGDGIALRRTVTVSPYPTDGNTRIVEIGDVVVRNLVVARLEQDDTHTRGEHATAGTQDVVIHDIVTGEFLVLVLGLVGSADADTAATQVVQVATAYRVVLTSRTDGQAPGSYADHLASQDLSVEENLRFYATVFGTTVEANYDSIKEIYSQIEMFKDRRARDLSGGMKQKLALCCALVHKPEVLFLDEPTTGVDAVSRKEFWAMLGRIKASGVTIFVSTPYMDEASLCDRIALILNGRIIDQGSPEEIRSRYPHRIFSVKGENMFSILKALRPLDGVVQCSSFGCECHVSVTDDGPDGNALLAALEADGLTGCAVEPIRAGIEDCFIGLS